MKYLLILSVVLLIGCKPNTYKVFFPGMQQPTIVETRREAQSILVDYEQQYVCEGYEGTDQPPLCGTDIEVKLDGVVDPVGQAIRELGSLAGQKVGGPSTGEQQQ